MIPIKQLIILCLCISSIAKFSLEINLNSTVNANLPTDIDIVVPLISHHVEIKYIDSLITVELT
jgi:hypothetical protein